jgi:hypothetical protein
MEIQGLLFTTKGPTPGAVLVEWNIQADPTAQGSAAMWGEQSLSDLKRFACLAHDGARCAIDRMLADL